MATTLAQIRAFRNEINTVRRAAMTRNVKLSAMMRAEIEAILRGERDLEDLMKDKEKMTTTTFMLDDDLLNKYKQFAADHGLSMEKAMRMALRSIVVNTTHDEND